MLSPIFVDAKWYGTTNYDKQRGALGLSFEDHAGVKVRLALSAGDCAHVVETISDFLKLHGLPVSHSERSSGMPSPEGSPQEGQ